MHVCIYVSPFVVCYYCVDVLYCGSEDGQLQMMLKSGRFQVEHIHKRRVYVFHVEKENDWTIRYTRLSEYPFLVDHTYRNDGVVQLGNGNDNKEVEVSEQLYMY